MSELNIPESWAETELAILCEAIADIDHKMPKATSEGYPFLSAKDVSPQGELLFDNVKYISKKDYDHYSRKIKPRLKDIIYTRIGTIGRAAIVEDERNFLVSYSCCTIRPHHDAIDVKFLKHFLTSANCLSQAHSGAKGIGVPDLGITTIKNFETPLPPLLEQERIVQKIESCSSKIEEAEQNLNKVEILLERLSISFLTNNGDWLEHRKLEDLTEERVERIKQKNPSCRKVGVDNEKGVTDLRISGKQNFENYKIVRRGDILYNPMRINVGSLALYNDTEEAITSPDYIVFSVKEGYSKWLVFKFLKSSHGSDEISKKLTGSVRERLYYKKLKEIPFPCPSKDIHQKAEIVIETINNQILSQKLLFSALFLKLKDSILQKAFEGSLVEQIESEGTGHELLQKIMAQKSQEVTRKETTKKKVAKKAST